MERYWREIVVVLLAVFAAYGATLWVKTQLGDMRISIKRNDDRAIQLTREAARLEKVWTEMVSEDRIVREATRLGMVSPSQKNFFRTGRGSR